MDRPAMRPSARRGLAGAPLGSPARGGTTHLTVAARTLAFRVCDYTETGFAPFGFWMKSPQPRTLYPNATKALGLWVTTSDPCR